MESGEQDKEKEKRVEEEEKMEEGEDESPSESGSDSEHDSEGDGLAAFMWGRRFRGQLPHDQGEEDDEPSPPEDDVPKYDRKYFWTHYVDSGFPNRVNHAVCSLQDKDDDCCCYAYSMGGYHADEDERTVLQADTRGGPFFKSTPIDIHCLDYDTKTWTRCEPPPKDKYINTTPFERAPRIPGSRYGHTVCHYKGKVYMYGGRNDEEGSFSDIDCYDTTRNVWLKLHTSGDGPSSRDGHACTLLGNEMIIHGGFASRAIKFSGDMYAFSLDHHSWRKFPKRGERVPERDFHSAVVAREKVVVFGGRSDVFAPFFTANDIYPNEFFYYNLEISQWFKAPKNGPYRPDGRRSLTAVAMGDSILYFGGYNATKKTHYGDLFMLNTITWDCVELRPFGDAPPPRRRVGCARIGNNLMICGGTSPKEVERNGKKIEILFDHSDMYILHLIPTLEQQCIMSLVKHKINISILPLHMQERITDLLSQPMKTITRLADSAQADSAQTVSSAQPRISQPRISKPRPARTSSSQPAASSANDDTTKNDDDQEEDDSVKTEKSATKKYDSPK